MKRGGFAGRVLHVDLTKGETNTLALNQDWAVDFLGGFGLTVKLAYESMKPGSGALGPENTIVLGAGPLVGTDLPACSRVFAVTKLPTSGTIGWSGAGGVTFGCMLKNAGYDHIIVKGRAEQPVYLEILDDRVTLRDASFLWGRGVAETCGLLWKEDTRPSGVLAIGQGGEKGVKFSMAYIDRIATLGRGGLGAVMGSKNLKAVFVRGTKGVQVADEKQYKRLREDILGRMRGYRYLKEWQDLGMIQSFPFVDKETYYRIRKRRLACVSCPVGCKDVVEIRDGDLKGLVACSSSAINLFTPVIYGMKDYRQAVKLISELDEYGLDMFEFLGLMVFTRILFENGVIPEEHAEPEIALDSLESMERWAAKVVRREGLGDILAEGFQGVISEFGKQAEALAPALVKGMHPYAGPGAALPWNLFGTMELGQVLDLRGPHVGSSGSPTYFARRPLEVFPKHLERMGVPPEAVAQILPEGGPGGERAGLKVGRLLRYSHRWFAILGSLGICARAQINRFYSASFCAEAYEAVTGIRTSLSALLERADRAWTLLKLANLREGYRREREEVLPSQWFREGGFKEYVGEEPLSKEQAEEMIEDYYREWKWDQKTGVPSAEALEELGLEGLV